MQNQQTQISTEATGALSAAYPELPQRRVVLTVRQFHQRNPAFSESALRNLIFKAEERHSTKGIIPGNGLIQASAIIRLGRRVLIDEARFLAWVDSVGGVQQ